jgi:hypothetical protein
MAAVIRPLADFSQAGGHKEKKKSNLCPYSIQVVAEKN